MMPYQKINSIYKRDDRGNFISEFSCIEFEELFLYDLWIGSEKIDGTNIRIHFKDGQLTFLGRKEN